MQPRKFMRFFVIIAIILLQASFIASALAAESKESSNVSVQAIPTLPPTNGSISGVVTSESTGAAIQGATVVLYRQNGIKWKKETSAKTNKSGQYTFKKRKPGVFRVEFKASRYRTEYFNNATTLASATNITLAAGGGINNINAALAAR